MKTLILRVSRSLIVLVMGAVVFCGYAALLPSYACKMTKESIQIDGVLNETIWGLVDTLKFLENIAGGQPLQATKAFATWDSTNLYVAYITQDNYIKGTLTQRDAALYTEEAVELFFDADGDGTTYIELEWNCKNAIWDGLLPSGSTAWNATGMISAVKLKGTANNSSDVDTGMTVEVKIPWKALDTNMSRHISLPPKNNDQMRINFYRIDQRTNVASQDLSAWSPTMNSTFHTPGKFGTIVFSASVPTAVTPKGAYSNLSNSTGNLSVKANTAALGTVRFSCFIPHQSGSELSICAASGQTIKTFKSRLQISGLHEIVWDGADMQGNKVTNGVYFASLHAGGQRSVCPVKMIR